jgi:putative ABC transport system permease protein
MGVIWFKIWFDLWHNKTRTLLAVLSIAAGVFAVGAIFGMSDLLTSNMDRSHQSVVPPHINIILAQTVDRETLLNLEDVPGVEGIEPYNNVSVLYKLHPQDAQWRQGIIHMRGDWVNQKYELVQLRDGHWPAQKNEIGVERMAAQFLNVGIGDSITFKIGDQQRTLPITSLIRHPFVPPPEFEDLAFFFMNGDGLERFGVPNDRYDSFFVRVTPYSSDHAKEVATAIKDKLAKQNIRVAAFVYQDPNKHWGRAFMDGFTLVQEILAVICVIMSAILVYNTLTNLITQQTNQIGIIKAIGGRTPTIIGIYLVSAFVYGLLALVIALPLGAIVAFVVTRIFLNMFNIDYNQFHVSTQAVVYQVLSALAAPLLAGFPPVMQGAKITVQQAIANYGLGGGYGSSWLDRIVEGIGQRWLPSHYATALGNMFRRKGRLLLTQLVLITAGAAFLMVMSLNSSISYTMDNIFARQQYDTMILFRENQRAGRVMALAAPMQGVEKSELRLVQSASMYLSGQLIKEAGIGTNIEGIPAESDFFKPLIVAGRWILPGDGRVVVLTRETAQKNYIKVGDIVTLNLGELGKDQWQVIGIYEPVFVGGFSSDTIYAPLDALYKATKKFNQGTYLYVRTTSHTAEATTAITTQLKNLYENHGLKVVQSQTQPDLRKTDDYQFNIVISMMLSLSVIVAIVGGIALMGALSIGVIERTKEIGVLRAVGARSRTILGIFIMEGMLQGMLSWFVAIPISLLAGPAASNALGQAMFGANLDYQYNWLAVGIWLVMILVVSALASILPARSATRISIRDSLAYA